VGRSEVRCAAHARESNRLALGLTVVAEFTLVLWLRGLSVREYLAGRNPVAATVYYVTLLAFAIMPLVVERRQSRHLDVR
jgi:hypothetical protein